MKKLSMLLVLCAAILPLGAIETFSANQVANVSAPHGFSIAQGETLTIDSIKEKSGASGDVTVSQAALNAVNSTGSAGIIVNLPIAVNGGSYNIVVAKAGSNVATNGTTAIYAANIVAGANFDINNAITLASVKAYDLVNGYTLTSQVSVIDNGNTITFSVNGVSKQITVSNRGGSKEATTPEANGQTDPNQPGQQDTPQDTPQEETPQQPQGVTIDANDIKISPEAAKTIKAESDLIKLMGAKGNDVDGSPLNITVSTTDFAAIQAGTEGDYMIKFSAETASGETVSTTATLMIRPFKLEDQQGQVAFISANNKLLKTAGVTESVKTIDDLKTVMGAKATVSGQDALAQVKVTAVNDTELLKGTPGIYEVSFEIKGQDQFTSAKATAVLTIVSDDTPITPDGKGYISATNFLITTDEAKSVTSNNDYIAIHSVHGNYDGRDILVSVQVPDNILVKKGIMGIYDVNLSIDNDSNPNTTDDQVSVTKKLTVVMDTDGQWVNHPFTSQSQPGEGPGSSYPTEYELNTVYDYSSYTKEQRIEGKFVISTGTPGQANANLLQYSPEEFVKLTYDEFVKRALRVRGGINGEYIDFNQMGLQIGTPNYVGGTGPDNNNGQPIGPDLAPPHFMPNVINVMDPQIFKDLQENVQWYMDRDQDSQTILLYKPVIYPGSPEKIVLTVNGEEFASWEGSSIALGAHVEIIGPTTQLPNIDTAPSYDDMIAPDAKDTSLYGNADTVVLRSQLNDTSVANVASLTNTKALVAAQVVDPQSVTLNPTTIPAYGTVQATFTQDGAQPFTANLYVYPDNAIINPMRDGYVAGEDNMVTQGEFGALTTPEQFFNLIQASSATKSKEFANPVLTCDKMADLKAGKVGGYTLTLENADKTAKKQIVFTIRPNKSAPTTDNKGYVDAVGSFVSQAQAQQIAKVDQLAGLNNATAIYHGQQLVTGVSINPDDFAKIQAGTRGVYKVTYTVDGDGDATTTEDTATKTVNLAVAPEGSVMTGDGLGFIYAQDATIMASQAQALTDINELITIHDAFAFYGENEEAPIVVKTDFAAIQASCGGQYPVTFLLDGGNNPLTREAGLQPNQAEISVVLTVVDDLTGTPAPTPVVAQPAPQMPTGVKNAAITLGLVVVVATVALVIIKRNRK